MTLTVTNAQRAIPIQTARLSRLARRAMRYLKIAGRGELAITFLDTARMHQLNRRFLRHNRPTDVLTFRYDGEPVVGEIFIAPAQARAYARRHGLPYAQELARYVLHGLLHWLGQNDRSAVERQQMRQREDALLACCGMNGPWRGRGRETRGKQTSTAHAPRPAPLAPTS